MSYDNLIHKMKKANPNKWPALNNPYVPKNNSWNNPQPWAGQYTNSYWGGNPINSWGTGQSMYSSVPSTISHGIMTEEDLQKKKVTIKKYRSIDDPWEVSTWTQSNEG